MPIKKKIKSSSIPLIIEDHPAEYKGYPFITLIQHRTQHILSIVDNSDDKNIRAFVLDLCGPSQVDENMIIEVASNWFFKKQQKYPLSFEFSQLGLTHISAKIYRTYNIEFVTRVIGPLPRFNMNDVFSVKRRRKKTVPAGMEIRQKVVKLI